MARSEYSRLRGIAERRLDRLESAGLNFGNFKFPKVGELKTKKAREQALASVQEFLAGGTKLGEVRKTVSKLSEDQITMLKGAKGAGLSIMPNEYNAFIEYADYRLSQNKDSSWYTVVDDFEKIQKKGASSGELMKDFARFKADREALLLSKKKHKKGAYSSRQIDKMWSDFIRQL